MFDWPDAACHHLLKTSKSLAGLRALCFSIPPATTTHSTLFSAVRFAPSAASLLFFDNPFPSPITVHRTTRLHKTSNLDATRQPPQRLPPRRSLYPPLSNKGISPPGSSPFHFCFALVRVPAHLLSLFAGCHCALHNLLSLNPYRRAQCLCRGCQRLCQAQNCHRSLHHNNPLRKTLAVIDLFYTPVHLRWSQCLLTHTSIPSPTLKKWRNSLLAMTVAVCQGSALETH